jgi:peptidoglycan/LPS O-acetylase OafA/YrhL
MLVLGDASYGLYLFHAIAIQFHLAGAAALGLPWLRSWPAFVAGFFAIVAFAIVVYIRVEEPARRWVRRSWLRPGDVRRPLPVPARVPPIVSRPGAQPSALYAVSMQRRDSAKL